MKCKRHCYGDEGFMLINALLTACQYLDSNWPIVSDYPSGTVAAPAPPSTAWLTATCRSGNPVRIGIMHSQYENVIK